jgi:hypothetical protein
MTTFRSIEDRVQAIAELAYYLWRERGCPNGSPEEDWYNAELIHRRQLPNQGRRSLEGVKD